MQTQAFDLKIAADRSQTLLRYNLQPCSLAKPFNEMVVGFYVHTDMNFVMTERREGIPHGDSNVRVEAHALAGAYEE